MTNHLPGTICVSCRAFNGEHGAPGEQPRTHCRVCGAEFLRDLTGTGRADLLEIIESLKKELAAVYENLSTTQARCTELLNEKRQLEWRISRLPNA